MEQTFFRKGFGLKTQVQPVIDAEYPSRLVDRVRTRGPDSSRLAGSERVALDP